MNLLALDVGNTHTDAALFQSGRLVRRTRWASEPDQPAAALQSTLQRHVPEAGDGHLPIMLSTVILSLADRYLHALPHVRLVGADADLGYTMAVPEPGQIGSDRLAACAAAVARWGAPVVVIDSGTAATLSLVDATGRFIGGGIMPGLRSGLAGLLAAAPRLPDPDLLLPVAGIGQTTVDAVRFGTVRGHAGALQGLIQAGLEAVGPAPVVATGGSLPLVASWLQGLTAYEPDLVLWGLYEIGRREAAGG